MCFTIATVVSNARPPIRSPLIFRRVLCYRQPTQMSVSVPLYVRVLTVRLFDWQVPVQTITFKFQTISNCISECCRACIVLYTDSAHPTRSQLACSREPVSDVNKPEWLRVSFVPHLLTRSRTERERDLGEKIPVRSFHVECTNLDIDSWYLTWTFGAIKQTLPMHTSDRRMHFGFWSPVLLHLQFPFSDDDSSFHFE